MDPREEPTLVSNPQPAPGPAATPAAAAAPPAAAGRAGPLVFVKPQSEKDGWCSQLQKIISDKDAARKKAESGEDHSGGVWERRAKSLASKVAGDEVSQGSQIVQELLSQATELRELIFDGRGLTPILADILKCAVPPRALCAASCAVPPVRCAACALCCVLRSCLPGLGFSF